MTEPSTTVAGAGDGTAQTERRRTFTAVTASTLGWAFDLYDLFILLFVASTIGPLLFPGQSPTLQLAYTYGSYAVTLVVRPLGSLIFGAIADRSGRRRAMILAIMGVGVLTALMGTVPTYAAVGIIAPIIFIALRLVQGIFVGGVVASTHTLGTETGGKRWRGVISGIVGASSAGMGGMLASIAFLIVSVIFPGDQFSVWGWRVMFFTGIGTAAFSLFVFSRVHESPIFQRLARNDAVRKTPVRDLFANRTHRNVFLLNLTIVAGVATQYYLTLGYLPTLFAKNVKLSQLESAAVLIPVSAIAIISPLLFGELSERIGRRRKFFVCGAINLPLLPLVTIWLGGLHVGQTGQIIIAAFALSFFANASISAIIAFLNERFPTAIRATGTGVSWNTGFAIGGIMPTFVSLAAPSIDAVPEVLAIFLAVAVVLMIVGSVLVGETSRQELA